MKVVINCEYGGFGLSNKAKELLGTKSIYDLPRHNLNLIKVVEELGILANDEFSDLKIVEIPDEVDYVIMDYDGMETIHEKHRVWY